MQGQEIAAQTSKAMEHMDKCCMNGCTSGNLTPMCVFGILVLIGLIWIIVMQGKVLKELRRGRRK